MQQSSHENPRKGNPPGPGSPQSDSSQASPRWTVRVPALRLVESANGSLLAHTDIELSCCGETLRVYGLSVLEGDAGARWVSWPQRKGREKYFPVVAASKGLRSLVESAVLARFDALKSEGDS